jgi:serine phosphatase RsbU (regulator of sigma subunit)
MYYRSIKHVGWVMAIVVPENVITSKAKGLNLIILLTMFAGLGAIYLLCRQQIKEITNPFTAQQAALERELRIAHDIQLAMVPKSLDAQMSPLASDLLPLTTDIDLYASLTPARDVGGDLYDFFLRDNLLFFCIGDVSGKGMPAALMMAVVRAMFRSETRRTNSAVAIVEQMNHNLSEEYTGGYFVTMFVGILNLTTGHLDYCNAGHEAPLVIKKEGVKQTPICLPVKPNLPVGALPEWDYEGQEAQLQSGDMLFLYTDGLSEAKNTAGEQLGRDRVMELASEHSHETTRKLVESMDEAVKLHAGDADQSDDITLLAIKCPQLAMAHCQLSMRSSMEDIASLTPFISEATEQAGMEEKEAKRIRLAVEEAVANVINHGEATNINLNTSVENDMLVFTINDDGLPFDPTQASATDLSVPPDQRPPGGMGIILLHQMTDGLAYQRIDGHNILTMKKKIYS